MMHHLMCLLLSQDGNTPLHIAAIKNMSTVVNVLLERKANADFVNKVLQRCTRSSLQGTYNQFVLQRSKWPYQLATDGELKRILQEARVRFDLWLVIFVNAYLLQLYVCIAVCCSVCSGYGYT